MVSPAPGGHDARRRALQTVVGEDDYTADDDDDLDDVTNKSDDVSTSMSNSVFLHSTQESPGSSGEMSSSVNNQANNRRSAVNGKLVQTASSQQELDSVAGITSLPDKLDEVWTSLCITSCDVGLTPCLDCYC